jgi:hypothetical protein
MCYFALLSCLVLSTSLGGTTALLLSALQRQAGEASVVWHASRVLQVGGSVAFVYVGKSGEFTDFVLVSP